MLLFIFVHEMAAVANLPAKSDLAKTYSLSSVLYNCKSFRKLFISTNR